MNPPGLRQPDNGHDGCHGSVGFESAHGGQVGHFGEIQKPLSFTCPANRAPVAAAKATHVKPMPMPETTGAIRPAAVIIATVPEPCAKRMMTAVNQVRRIILRLYSTTMLAGSRQFRFRLIPLPDCRPPL